MAVSVSDSLESLTRAWESAPHAHLGVSERFVLGDIHLDSEVLLVGEAPGEDEDLALKAFVGRAGRRLDETLEMVGLPRQRVSVTNVLPRRPPDNKMTDDLRKEAAKVHGPYLDRLAALHPNLKAVGLMGATALQWKTGVSKIEDHLGDEFRRDGIWYIPMYHPAATLYRRSNHRWLLRDLAWLKALAEGDVLDTSTMWFDLIVDGSRLAGMSRDIVASPITYVDLEAAAEPPAKALWWWDPRSRVVVASLGWFAGGEIRTTVVEWNGSTVPILRDILAGTQNNVGGSNCLYFDLPFLRRLDFQIGGRTPLDSYPIAKLNDENRGLGLKDLAKQHLRAVNHVPSWGDAERGVWQARWSEWPSMTEGERAERVAYSGKDAWLGIQVLKREVETLKRDPRLVRFYRDAVIPQAEGIEEMNREGLPVDLGRAKEMEAMLEAKAEAIQTRLSALVPADFRVTEKSVQQDNLFGNPERTVVPINFNSPAQVSALLTHAGFPRVAAGGKKKNKTDRPSSDRFVLLRLHGLPRGRYPEWAFQVIAGVLDLRDAVKEKGFIRGKKTDTGIIAGVERSHDDRLHPTFKATTVTWRTAAEDPNSQQWPTPIKSLVEAPTGKVLVQFDHNALELRGLADQSGDPTLTRRILDGDDMHWRHATAFMGMDYASPKEKPIRDAFKTLAFSTAYGAGDEKVADALRDDFRKASIGPNVVRRILDARGVPHGDDVYLTLAREWLAFLDGQYPRLKSEFRRLVSKAKRDGCTVRSKFGFARRLPDLDSEDNGARGDAERQAWNLGPQSLSVLTWIAWGRLKEIRADMELESAVRLILQEHDSLLFLCDEEVAPVWYSVVEAVMPDIDWKAWDTEFAVPLSVEGSTIRYWA